MEFIDEYDLINKINMKIKCNNPLYDEYMYVVNNNLHHLLKLFNDRENGSGNYCCVCFVDMGINNPRQYCNKTYCPYMYELSP